MSDFAEHEDSAVDTSTAAAAITDGDNTADGREPAVTHAAPLSPRLGPRSPGLGHKVAIAGRVLGAAGLALLNSPEQRTVKLGEMAKRWQATDELMPSEGQAVEEKVLYCVFVNFQLMVFIGALAVVGGCVDRGYGGGEEICSQRTQDAVAAIVFVTSSLFRSHMLVNIYLQKTTFRSSINYLNTLNKTIRTAKYDRQYGEKIHVIIICARTSHSIYVCSDQRKTAAAVGDTVQWRRNEVVEQSDSTANVPVVARLG